MEFIHQRDDLVSLGGGLEDSWLNAFVEDILIAPLHKVTQV